MVMAMVAVDPKDSIVRREVQSVDFGFYTDDDVRARSVCEITSSQSFDPTNNALPGGLYDPRLGGEVSCPTCALPKLHCPGHFGHIELAVKVYHPLAFLDLLTFLRLKCLHCHRLKISRRQARLFECKFHLLYSNQLGELVNLDNEIASAIKSVRSGGDVEEENEKKPSNRIAAAKAASAMDTVLAKYAPAPATSRYPLRLTSYQRHLRKELIAECMSACKSAKKCDTCNAISPRIRHDSHNKVFQAQLPKSSQRLNDADNIKIESAMVRKSGYDSEDTDRDDDGDDEEMKDAADASAEEDESDEDVEETTTSNKGDKFMHPGEVYAQFERSWELQAYLCNCLFGPASFDAHGFARFFMQAIPVPPPRFRPAMYLNGMAVEHAQTQSLSRIIQFNEQIRGYFATANEPRAYTAWIDLQTTVNVFMDSSRDPSAGVQTPAGIRQILERKEGLFRKNMMGKRVNYACRSVISPDPYVGANEIGLPRYFATVLTYPTPVTDYNVKELRNLVERGAHNYPGARWVETEGKRFDLSKMKPHQRQAMAAKLLRSKPGRMPVIVGRQLRDGDYVLMNRQPTLHKPGIMAHRVRILHNPTQKTIRMHYANCNTYNADFDGDEMNCHFPQSELARAEAQNIAKTDLQYIVPTDGSPLRGLIQDHVVGGVKLTKRDTFLEKWEYQQLLFAALASLPGLEVIRSDMDIELLPPAITKPRPLWTGKQVISTLLLHLRKGSDRDGAKTSELPGLSTERKAKTPETAFGSAQEEHLVLIREGELLRGVLDKAAFGATDFSIVHAVFEAYGPEKAGLLLNSLGRLFTAYIQFYSGHSCRMEDLVLTETAEIERRKLVQRAYNLGSRAAKAWADSEGGKVPIEAVSGEKMAESPLKPVEAASASAKIGQLLSGKEGAVNFAALDGYMQGQLNPLASEIVKKSLPHGLAVPFPYNTFGVMTMTGAKGSIVNQSQVTCALGQQALEGRRVPRLSSGRTLPSFAPYDPNPRADGFVMDRFLTGIRPQEYYFHCMAGREGLVDTAVKTSRSGYLQRCLVKHLEELKICYDQTVRNAEGGVVQFLYGEDGLDPTKASYLDCSAKSFEYMARNYDALKRRNLALPHSSIDLAAKDASDERAIKDGTYVFPHIGENVLARRLRAGTEWKRGALCHGWHRAIVTKVRDNGDRVDLKYLSDGEAVRKVPLEANLGRCGSMTLKAESNIAVIVKPACLDPILSSNDYGHRVGSSGACVSERVGLAARQAMKSPAVAKAMSSSKVSAADLSFLVGAKYSSSLCHPGEAVGCIAAQSIGEPSTQMTLNTFHLAGAGANVTLGIPRLREIIMTASHELKTPTMSVPLREQVTEKEAMRMARDFTKLTLMELIAGHHGVAVTERLEQGGAGEWLRSYYVTMKLHPIERIREAFGLSLRDVAKVVAENYVPLLSQYMKAELRRSAVQDIDAEVMGGQSSNYVNELETGGDESEQPASQPMQDDLGDDDDADDVVEEDAPHEEDGADAAKYRRRSASISYDDGDLGDSDGDEDLPASQIPRRATTPAAPATTPFESLSRKVSPTIDERTNSIHLQPLQVDPSAAPLLMVGLVEKAAAATLVRSRKKISRAYVADETDRGRCLSTAGINFSEIWQLDESTVDHSLLVSNDIWAICCAYGVEAARRSIVEQIKSVFGAYGITVDPRHLSLIADYMTFEGGFKAMNRIGMEASSSPFLQMSFETTAHFMKQAAESGQCDDLSSPSGNLVMGRPVRHGTGSFALLAAQT